MIPVYDEAGDLFASSVVAAARRLGCHPDMVRRHHVEVYRDGWRLVSRPDPRNVGRRGGPRIVGAPVIGPDGERWTSAREAAAALGCTPQAIRRIATLDSGSGVWRMPRRPQPRGVKLPRWW